MRQVAAQAVAAQAVAAQAVAAQVAAMQALSAMSQLKVARVMAPRQRRVKTVCPGPWLSA